MGLKGLISSFVRQLCSGHSTKHINQKLNAVYCKVPCFGSHCTRDLSRRHDKFFAANISRISNFLRKERNFLQKRRNQSHRHNGLQHGHLSLFWYINMAAMTSCDNNITHSVLLFPLFEKASSNVATNDAIKNFSPVTEAGQTLVPMRFNEALFILLRHQSV